MESSLAIRWAESGRVPDALIRIGIRRLLHKRLAAEGAISSAKRAAWLAELARGPIAVHTDQANDQHYEVTPAFFEAILGPRLKYSSGYWAEGPSTLAEAEEAMLALSAKRAQIEEGQTILDLGCGWGSLSLWLAEHYPGCRVVAMSNSKLQRESIEARRIRKGLTNLRIVTADINDFDPGERFDRVVSVEMFEHLRNWPELLRRVHGWLVPGGKLFVHVFCHRGLAYPYEDRESADWMARYFFSGGIMPSYDLLPNLAGPFDVEARWSVNGQHYQKTLEAWLANLDQSSTIERTLAATYGAAQAKRWLQRWRIFLMACSELFGYRQGEEWHVAHYRLSA